MNLSKLLFVFVCVSTLLISQAFAFDNGQSASLVIGQPDFTSSGPELDENENEIISASGLSSPYYVAFDSSGNLWVADRNNNRILRYSTPFTNGEAATLVIGQPDFISNGGGTTDSTLSSPQAITFDSSGNLWVVDRGNNRVLRFETPSNGEAATLVIGQPNFESSDPNTGGGGGAADADGLDFPLGIAFDSSGNLWVTDRNNNRILRYSTPFANYEEASLVIGQRDFESSNSNTDENGEGDNISASGLDSPRGIAFDSSGNLWVVDRNNDRVLRFPVSSIENGDNGDGGAADLVIGQSDFTSNGEGTSASTFDGPYGIAFDSSGNLWVSDDDPNNNDNSRVLRFDTSFTNGEAATLVIGQPDFTSSGGGTTVNTLDGPRGIAFDSSGNLWVADDANNGLDNTRVLRYDGPTTGSSNFQQISFTSSISTADRNVMIAKGLSSDFTMPSSSLASSSNFNPFDSQFTQKLKFTTQASKDTSLATLISDYTIQQYSKPSGWSTSTVWSVPPSIVPVTGDIGQSAVFRMNQLEPQKPLYLPFTDADALSNGAKLGGVRFALASGVTADNANVNSKFLSEPPTGVSAFPGAQMYMSFDLSTTTDGVSFDSSSTFSTAPSVSFTQGPVANQVNDPTTPTNTVNSAITCPKVDVFLISGSTASSSGITVTRNTSGDTSSVCGYTATLQHFSNYVSSISTATTTTGDEGSNTKGDVSAPSFSLDISTIQRTFPENILKTVQEDPFVPIEPVKNPTVDLPLVINDNGYAITKYANTIQTNTIQVKKLVTIKMNLNDETGIEHIALYTNLRGMQRDISDSDTHIIFDEYAPVEVSDPNELFYFADVTYEKEGTKYSIKFDVIFAKPMEKSDIIFRVWDEKRNSADTKIFDAWEVIEGTPPKEQPKLPETKMVAFGTKEMRGLYPLTQIDKKEYTWTDEFGNIYKHIGNNSFDTIYQIPEEPREDPLTWHGDERHYTWFAEYKQEQVRLAEKKFEEVVGYESIQKEIPKNHNNEIIEINDRRADPQFQQLLSDEAQRASIKLVQLFPKVNEKWDTTLTLTWNKQDKDTDPQFQQIQPLVYEVEEPPELTFITLPSFIFELEQLLSDESQQTPIQFVQLLTEINENDDKQSHTITGKYKHRNDPEFQQLLADEAQRAAIQFAQLFPNVNENDDKESKIMTWRDLEREKRQFQQIQPLVYEVEEPPELTFITLPSFIFELEQDINLQLFHGITNFNVKFSQ